jgi:hypothetical protein
MNKQQIDSLPKIAAGRPVAVILKSNRVHEHKITTQQVWQILRFQDFVLSSDATQEAKRRTLWARPVVNMPLSTQIIDCLLLLLRAPHGPHVFLTIDGALCFCFHASYKGSFSPSN